MTVAAQLHIVDGWTMADLHRAAAWACASARGQNTDYAERYAAAWFAIAERLAATTEPLSTRQATALAMDAISTTLADWRHHYGISPRGGDSPSTVRYWRDLAAPTATHELAVVDRLSLDQIWPTLTDLDRQALAALATYGTYQAAADALDINYQAYARRVRMARGRFLAAWHEGETPSRVWRYDRRQDRTASSRRTPFTGRKHTRAAA